MSTAISETVSDRMVKPICAAPLSAACQRRVARLDVAGDVLDHDDGVVHHEPGGDGERHQREVVQAEPEEHHHPEGPDQREGHRDRRDDGGRERCAGRGRSPARPAPPTASARTGRPRPMPRIVTVRSVSTETSTAAGREACSCGSSRLMRSTTAITLAPGCRWMFRMTAGRAVHPGRLAHVLGVVDHVGHVVEGDRGAVAVRDDQRLVVPAREELVVGPDDRRLARPVEAALGLVDVGGRHRGAQILQGEAVRRERGRVGLHPHRGPLPAADADEPDAGKLGDLLGEPRIGQVLDLGERQGRRGQRRG